MRRAAPTLSISPQVIRQFALITIIVTGLLAMFASGENAQFAEAIKAREAESRLAKAEAVKLGSRKIGTAYREQEQEQTGEGFEKLNDRDSTQADDPQWSAGGAGTGQVPPAFLRARGPDFSAPLPANLPKGVIVRRKKPIDLSQRSRDRITEAARQRDEAYQRSGADDADASMTTLTTGR